MCLPFYDGFLEDVFRDVRKELVIETDSAVLQVDGEDALVVGVDVEK